MKTKLVVPKFKNEDEERDFWDKIDITEYFEPSDFKRVSSINWSHFANILSQIYLLDSNDENTNPCSRIFSSELAYYSVPQPYLIRDDI